jgi:hypothetical protein
LASGSSTANLPVLIWGQKRWKASGAYAVIPRENGVSSTLRLLDSIAAALEYWIIRFRG